MDQSRICSAKCKDNICLRFPHGVHLVEHALRTNRGIRETHDAFLIVKDLGGAYRNLYRHLSKDENLKRRFHSRAGIGRLHLCYVKTYWRIAHNIEDADGSCLQLLD